MFVFFLLETENLLRVLKHICSEIRITHAESSRIILNTIALLKIGRKHQLLTCSQVRLKLLREKRTINRNYRVQKEVIVKSMISF